MSEELGNEIKYTVGDPLLFMCHERVEVAPGNPTVRIFAIGYPAVLEKGDVQHSERHTEMLWVDPGSFKFEDCFKGDWLKGMKEFQELWRKKHQ